MATNVNPYAAPQAELNRALDDDEVEPVRIFSVSGRLGRVRYLAYLMGMYLLVVGVIGGIAGATLGVRGGAANGPGNLFIGLVAIAYLCLFVMLIMFAIQRLHDFDTSGWWSLLVLVPLVNFIFGLVLLFKPGTDGRNAWRANALQQWWGDHLASVMPAMFVIGIVAAIALPAHTRLRQAGAAIADPVAALRGAARGPSIIGG